MMTTCDVIYEMFLKQVRTNGSKPAILTDEVTWSYEQLAGKAAAISQILPKGAKRIGLIVSHGPMQIASMLGVLKNGSAFIPAEPFLPDARIEKMMQDGKAQAIITDAPERFAYLGLPVIDASQFDQLEPVEDYSTSETPDDLAYILFTSGTTGRPKGVMISSANVCHYCRAFHHEFENGPGDRMLQYSVCSFDIFIEEVFTTLAWGAALVIPGDRQKKEIEDLMDFAKRHGVTMISGFPYLIQQIEQNGNLPESIRLLISGGDVLRESYCRNLRKKVSVYNTYGPSETTVCASYCDCSHSEPLEDGTFSIGKPVLETQIRILDENLQPVPQGTIGEICIFGKCVGQGYTNGSQEEQANFTTWNGERMYRSGDMGYVRPDGTLAFLHRRDDQVMILGKRVEPKEVENVIVSLPEVREAAVASFQDADNLSYLCAYVISKDGPLDPKELRSQLSMSLPSFIMIPEYFVQMNSLPQTINGKVDHEQLPVVLQG